METLLTIIGVLVAQVLLAGAGYVGYRIGLAKRPEPVKPAPVDETEKQRMEALRRDFRNVMGYNLETAMRRRPD